MNSPKKIEVKDNLVLPQNREIYGEHNSKIMQRQRGSSLLEVIAYLGIAAIVILGAIALLSNAFSSANSNRTATEVSTIRTGIKKLYMGQQASFTGLANSVLIAAKIFPASLNIIPASGTVNNPWGGTVVVAPSADTLSFTLTYTKVPKEVCINAVTGSGDWSSITVGANVLTPPVSPAQAVTNCSDANNTNTIIWTGA